MKRIILLFVVLVGAVVLLCSCDCKHENYSQATCTTPSICSDCGEIISNALGHTDGKWLTDKKANCTEDGSKRQICSVCEATIKTETLTKFGHAEVVDKPISPTCTTNGKTEGKHCSRCNKTLVAQTTVAALGHSYIETVTPPTITTDGYTTHICSACGNSYKDTIIPAGSVGLVYEVNSNGTTCTITGMGTCTDTEVYIPSVIDGYKVTIIGVKAFADCTAITSITIPETVITIGTRAFYGCTGLTEITIPESVSSIGTQIFYKSHIKTVYYNGTAGTNNLENVFLNEPSIENVIFGGTVVPYGICYGCSNLKNITLLDSVRKVEDRAFQNCKNLETANLGNSVQILDCCSFAGCVSLETIQIPKSVTYMFQVFYQCKLKSVHYGGTIDEWLSIEMYNTMFNGGYVNNVVYDLYINGTLVDTLILDDTQTTISTFHFTGCSVKTIIIPDSIRLISSDAFRDCKNLKNIFYIGSEDSWTSANIQCSAVKKAICYYYCEVNPDKSGNYWHYVDGVPTIWE